jgi:hypothetical protein
VVTQLQGLYWCFRCVWDKCLCNKRRNALGVYGAAAPIVGNAVLNAGISGLIAVATGANVEKSMLTGGLVGGAIASAPKIANTLLGGEQC